MANTTSPAVLTRRTAATLSWLGQWLILVPEAPLLATLLSIYFMLGVPRLLAVLAALLIVVFVVRTLALYLARLAFQAGRYKDAGALLQVALAIYPWSADALALRGVLALTQGESENARQAFEGAIRLLPGQASFYTALSSALIDLRRPAEAITAARQAIALDANHAQAYLYLAEAERTHGRESTVVEEQIRTGLAMAQHPEPQAALQCALAGHLLAERRFAEASLALHSAEALLSKCPAVCQAELRYVLGELFVAQGQFERAREHFQGAETLDPHGRFATAAWRAAHS